MKINVVKFMELQGVSFETPVKIEAGHDVGKSTIYRAVLFAVTGKDVNGKDFDGSIYPKKSDTIEDMSVEVQIEQSGVVFCKKAKGTDKRVKGSEDSTLQRSVTATYMIDFATVTKTEYDAKILEVFGNFQLFCNPDYFRSLDKDKKRSIFASIVKIDKLAYFDGIEDKTYTNGKITEQKKAIAAKQANLEELGSVQEPIQLNLVDIKPEIDSLQEQRNSAQPKFTEIEARENLDFNFQISEIEKSVFVPVPLKPITPLPNEPTLIDLDKLRKKYNELQISEPDTVEIETKIATAKRTIEAIRTLSIQIANYDENVKSAKCTVCQVCFTPCEYKRIEVEPLSKLQEQLSQLATVEECENRISKLESEKIDYLRTFEETKQAALADIKSDGITGKLRNEQLMFDYMNLCKVINETNADISTDNSSISKKNSLNISTFETDKATQIQALKSKLHVLQPVDFSEIDEKIKELNESLSLQQIAIDNYNELLGTYKHAQKRIEEISIELKALKSALIKHERYLIAFESAEKKYYTDFENAINSEMPENVKVSLFKKNLSNDGYSDTFDIEFDGSVYAGNGYTIAFYIFLCNWFQTKFEKYLPIFIDEAIILNESLYSNIKNTVILMRNDEQKTLKITEL
jgi:hypothetical protein